MPVSGQNWSHDPYQATLKEGRLYGRGSVDMKGFIGLCLAMVPDFLDAPLSYYSTLPSPTMRKAPVWAVCH